MENKWSWEQKTLISELIQGMELAKKFKVDLQTSSSAETKDFMLQKILSSYEKALMILRWNGSMGQSQAARETPGLLPEYPISVNGSPLREDFDRGLMDHQDLRDGSKKRKMMPRWTDHVKVSSETGVEGAHDDGYNWRKYGQKDILGAKYPRSYYRCTFRNTQNCWATKQVQRSDEDPSIFNITYRGKHTCAHGNNIVPPPAVPEQQDKKQHNHNSDVYHGQPSQQTLTTFRNSLIINKNLDNAEIPYPFTFPSTSFGLKTNENHNLPPLAFENKTLLGSVSQSVLPPSTPELNFFSVLPCQTNNSGVNNMQHSKYDLDEIILANASVTNSPIPDFDFSLDPNFPFDIPGFFS
ncbi:WRKY transcription factor [Quillaja saponaria]|uniref:WRKY transcription factor n=1 Tax=Quillaja saponaria TaxID=32244 RepID=A0AAD7L748_QUISA|nr:WRKY transcription factor [Quillaja saponaria]